MSSLESKLTKHRPMVSGGKYLQEFVFYVFEFGFSEGGIGGGVKRKPLRPDKLKAVSKIPF